MGHARETAIHSSHPAVIKRLNRAKGHLARVIAMIESGEPCVDVAQQLYAVERAILSAKRTFIHDHIDHCLTEARDASALDELKALAKVL